jgi:hypothetical protein
MAFLIIWKENMWVGTTCIDVWEMLVVFNWTAQ